MGAIRTGHTPLWGARRGKGGSWLWRLLASPLILWEYLFYQRPNVTTEKTRPADWARLQSEWRFWDALVCYVGPPSHFLWNIKCPLLGTMVVSCVVVLYEYGRTQLGWNVPDLDKSNVMNDAYRLSSFAMSLLLSLRLGRAYERWWSARCTFAGVGSAASTLVGQAVAWIDSPQLRNDIRRWAVVWHYSILHICTAAEDLHPKGAALLGEEELALYRASRKPRQLAYQQLRLLVVQGKRHGLSEDAALGMDATIVKGVSDAGTCVRIKFQALPQTLTLVSTGFLQIWLLLVPLGLQGSGWSWLQCSSPPCYCSVWMRRPHSWRTPSQCCRWRKFWTAPCGILPGRWRRQKRCVSCSTAARSVSPPTATWLLEWGPTDQQALIQDPSSSS